MKLLLVVCLTFCSLSFHQAYAQLETLQPADRVLTATILGSGSPQFNPERAGAAVLIAYGNTNILVDSGNGTQARISELGLQIRTLDAIVYTHHHLDHNEEFIPVFIRALLGGRDFTLAGPPPMTELAEATLSIYKTDIEYRMRRSGRSLEDVKDNFTLKQLAGGEIFNVGQIRVSTTSVNHSIDAVALRFDAGDQSIVVAGDLTYSATLSVLAKDAGILITDSGGSVRAGDRSVRSKAKQGKNKQRAGNHQRAHVTLDETARMAKEAGVDTLVLTHFGVDVIDEVATVAELRKNYDGAVLFAEDLMVLAPDRGAQSAFSSRGGALGAASLSNSCTVDLAFRNQVSIVEKPAQDQRVITSNAIPDHLIGTFPTRGNPNTVSQQAKIYQIDLTPQRAAQPTFLYDGGVDRGRPNYVFGVALNGVKIEPSANAYFQAKGGANTQWTKEALSPLVYLGEDCNNAHVQPNGEYHYHGVPTGLVSGLIGDKQPETMLLIGWAADGFAIYQQWGHEQPDDAGSALKALQPSYRLKTGLRSGDGQSAPDGGYTGEYVRDFDYVEGLGDLDACNGREGVTPEFPQGTYYYVLTDQFPFAGRCLVGTPSADFKIGGARSLFRGSLPPQNRQRRQGRSSEQVLARMDIDKDGAISRDEARGPLLQNFDHMDRNQDGLISVNELEQRRR